MALNVKQTFSWAAQLDNGASIVSPKVTLVTMTTENKRRSIANFSERRNWLHSWRCCHYVQTQTRLLWSRDDTRDSMFCSRPNRFSWKVTVCAGWCRAAAARPMTLARFSRSTLRSGSAACRRSTASAKRRFWAPGWRSLTLSTAARKKTPGSTSRGWRRAPPLSSSSAKTSCMKCSSRSLVSRSLSISSFIMPARSVNCVCVFVWWWWWQGGWLRYVLTSCSGSRGTLVCWELSKCLRVFRSFQVPPLYSTVSHHCASLRWAGLRSKGEVGSSRNAVSTGTQTLWRSFLARGLTVKIEMILQV